jgi:hypothetical protein
VSLSWWCARLPVSGVALAVVIHRPGRTAGPAAKAPDDHTPDRTHGTRRAKRATEPSKVVVLTQVHTFNGAHTPGLRIADVTPEGFLIRVNELYATNVKSDGTHGNETVGWFATTV